MSVEAKLLVVRALGPMYLLLGSITYSTTFVRFAHLRLPRNQGLSLLGQNFPP